MTESGISDQTAFSYKFKDDLKITNTRKHLEEEADFERSIGELSIDKIEENMTVTHFASPTKIPS